MLNASWIMRNCLKLSEAAEPNAPVWLRHLSSVYHKQKTDCALKRSSFQKVWNVCSLRWWHLHFTKYSDVFSMSKFAEVSMCVSAALNIKLPQYTHDNQNEFPFIHSSSQTNCRVSMKVLSKSPESFLCFQTMTPTVSVGVKYWC